MVRYIIIVNTSKIFANVRMDIPKNKLIVPVKHQRNELN